MTATPYKNVGRSLVDLHDGAILEPGQQRSLTVEEAALPHNRLLIDQGVLIQAQAAPKINATDEAIQLAHEHELDIHDVTGSGANGRITKGDVERHLKKKESD